MKYNFLFPALFILLFSSNATAQQGSWGLGARLGDPTGLTLKKYGAKTNVELSVGRSFYLYNHSYKNAFYRYNKFDDDKLFFYENYKARTPISIQLHIMKQKNIASVNGLSWYIGVGPQVRNERVEYFYRAKEFYGPGKDDYKWVNRSEVFNDIDAGIDGTLGLEYVFTDMPLTVFMDGTLFMEIFDEPFYPWGQAGVGVRYNFK